MLYISRGEVPGFYQRDLSVSCLRRAPLLCDSHSYYKEAMWLHCYNLKGKPTFMNVSPGGSLSAVRLSFASVVMDELVNGPMNEPIYRDLVRSMLLDCEWHLWKVPMVGRVPLPA